MYLPTDLSNYWFCDIEGDNLPSTVVWCVCAVSGTGEEVVLTNYQQIRDWFYEQQQRGCKFVFHNGLGYDVPTLNRLVGTSIGLGSVCDTMAMSMLFLPSLAGGHSLEAWGLRLHSLKGEFSDFSHLSDEMVTYCKQDAHLCGLVFRDLVKRMRQTGFSEENIHLETLAWYLVQQQKKNGFYFNIEGAHVLYATLRQLENEIAERVHEIWPPELAATKTFKRARLRDGGRTSQYLRHLREYEKLEDVPGTDEYRAYEYVSFNIGSPDQRSTKLLELGWVPGADERTPTGKPKPTNKGRLAPTLERFVTESEHPVPRLIAQWMEINARANMVNTWIEAYNDDTHCIHGSLWLANTLRYRHSDPNTANIPGVRTGESGPLRGLSGVFTYEARDLWTTRDPRTRRMVGVDAKGIQLRVLAHHLRNEAFANEVVNGDPHTYNQEIGGLRTRGLAKTFIYAFLLGAGDAKVGQIIGGSTSEGRALKNRFTNNFPGLKRLLTDLKRQVNRTGRIVLCDGTPLRVEHIHTRLGYLLQGDENRIMKQAGIFIWRECRRLGLDVIKVGDIHDEFQFDVLETDVDQFILVCEAAFKKAGETFGYTVPIECEAKVGLTWAETH